MPGAQKIVLHPYRGLGIGAKLPHMGHITIYIV